MIPEETVLRVLELLASGKHSQREVARLANVGLSTVQRIKDGRRQLRPGDLGKRRDPAALEKGRCPLCGRKAYLDPNSGLCVACEAARLKASKEPTPDFGGLGEPLGLELPDDPDTQARYREVRARAEARRREGRESSDQEMLADLEEVRREMERMDRGEVEGEDAA